MKNFSRFSAGLLSFLLLCGCWGGAFTGASLIYKRKQVGHNLESQYIALQARQALFENRHDFIDCHIDIASFNNDLVLVGQTPTLALKNKAQAMVADIPDIRHLYNFITIRLPTTKVQQMSDSWITTKIRSQIIADNDLDPQNFKVFTENGIIYLMGDVEKDQANIAVSIARDTDGVQRVVTIFNYIGYLTK